MSPANAINLRSANLVFGHKDSDGLASIPGLSDRARLGWGQFRGGIARAAQRTMLDGIGCVFQGERPAQIARVIVQTDAISMRDLMERRWRRPKKGKGHQPVDRGVDAASSDEDLGLSVAISIKAAEAQNPNLCAGAPYKASQPSESRHGIGRRKRDDFPNLNGINWAFHARSFRVTDRAGVALRTLASPHVTPGAGKIN